MKYLSILMRVFNDVLADKTRRRISRQEVSVHCNDLAKIIQRNYGPDLVVAIDTGGSIPGELISRILGIPIVHLVVRRRINIARRYSLDPIPLRWIMSMYHHFLFQTVKPVLSVNISIDISGKKILVVDDTVHTGATVDVAVGYLRQAGVLEIKMAALAYVSIKKPDFSVLPPGNYCFPWSRDYDDSKV
jgi:hypoxanthine phosphoribosyltransferase